MKRMSLLATTALFSFSVSALAQESPVGLWKSIDDQSGKPKAMIRISESGGEFRGKIEKLFRKPGEEQNPKCDKCEGARKDQPIIGMAILTGMKREGDEYTNGQLLDPTDGKIYKSRMSVAEGGKKLNVRGYVGLPLLGRTQTWLREE